MRNYAHTHTPAGTLVLFDNTRDNAEIVPISLVPFPRPRNFVMICTNEGRSYLSGISPSCHRGYHSPVVPRQNVRTCARNLRRDSLGQLVAGVESRKTETARRASRSPRSSPSHESSRSLARSTGAGTSFSLFSRPSERLRFRDLRFVPRRRGFPGTGSATLYRTLRGNLSITIASVAVDQR